ncbi:MAG: hypothetical protein Q7T33_08565 [Dehalococcoidia bacterium]|nr:hypothetical protein [Dehalococcoidia bacterium]
MSPRIRGLRLSLALLALALLAVAGLVTTALLITGSATVSAGGATYTGTTATGAPVSITVNADRTAVTEYHFGTSGSGIAFLWSPCGVGVSYTPSFEPIPISSGSFSRTTTYPPLFGVSGRDQVVKGTFFNAQVAGTVALVFPDFECNVETSWTATTTLAPGARLNGDVDCSGAVNIGDAQKIARRLISLAITQAEGCPDVGEAVE